jgi:hypothetical protein
LQAQSRSTTPVPFWLKTEDEEQVPELTLPRSSDDLLIDSNQAFRAAGVYEVLRHYYLLLRLSLFRFEDFCAALASEEQSNLLSEVSIIYEKMQFLSKSASFKLKFIYSEKATKICEISTVDLTVAT